MNTLRLREDHQLLLLVSVIFITCILVFWPLMTVLIWSTATAIALMPFHKHLIRRVQPAVSVILITLLVLLGILLVISASISILYDGKENITMVITSLITGLKNVDISTIMPMFMEDQVSRMPETIIQFLMSSPLSVTSNLMQSGFSIIIYFLLLSMMLYYGEGIWNTLTRTLSPKIYCAVEKIADISANTIYALIIVQISAAIIAFILALPFFYFIGSPDPLLFATLTGLAMLIPLIGAQVMIIIFAFYFLSIGDTWRAVVTIVVGYPLLSGWIDFYYRPVLMGKRVSIPPVLMMIGIFAGVPFLGIAGFIIGPVLVALAVTGYKILAEEVEDYQKPQCQG